MRFREIDVARGIAVAGMMLFNYAFALQYFGLFSFDGYAFWQVFPRVVAGAFIFISGVSLSISYSKSKDIWKYVRRGGFLFYLGVLISIATLVFAPQAPVLFGILHAIGVSTIISAMVLKHAKSSEIVLAAGLAAIVTGAMLSMNLAKFSTLFWLVPSSFATLDYFPLLPWLGVMLLGIYFGGRLYAKGKRKFSIKLECKPLEFLGRHSLAIYMAHIPLLIAALYAVGIRLF